MPRRICDLTALRRLVSTAFTERLLSRVEHEVQEAASRVIDAVSEKGECDFVTEIAALLPLRIICDLMGIPRNEEQFIFERSNIAHDATVPQSGRSATELTIGHNVASEVEVDALMAEAIKAGARVVKPAQKTFWGGYAGYFQDPDDHLWEVVYNPAFIPKD